MRALLLIALAALAACVPATPDVTGKSCSNERGCGPGFSCVNGRCARGEPPPGLDTLVARGSTWRYLETPSDPPATWTALSYDDSAWKSGRAPLGWGNPDEATTIGFGPDPANKYLTSYFRLQVGVSDTTRWSALVLRVRRDDGAVVYLNGAEIYRANLPAGPVSWSTVALTTVSSVDEQTYFETDVPASALVEGLNQLAAEVHQRSVDTADCVFDLELSGVP